MSFLIPQMFYLRQQRQQQQQQPQAEWLLAHEMCEANPRNTWDDNPRDVHPLARAYDLMCGALEELAAPMWFGTHAPLPRVQNRGGVIVVMAHTCRLVFGSMRVEVVCRETGEMGYIDLDGETPRTLARRLLRFDIMGLVAGPHPATCPALGVGLTTAAECTRTSGAP